MKWEEAGRGCSLGRHRKRPRPTHIPYSSADGKRCTTSGRRALQTHGESPGQSIHTRLRAAGGTLRGVPTSPAFCSLPGYLVRQTAGPPGLRLPPTTGAVASDRALPQHLPRLPQGSGPRPARRPQSVLPLRPARHPGRKRPCPGRSTRRRAHPAHSHLRAYVRHEGGLGRLVAATTADSPFPQHPAALRCNDARRQRRRLRLRFRQRRRPPAPAAGAPPIPRAAAAAVPPASGSAADTVRSAQATRPAYRPWDTPTSARSSQAEVPPTEREPATPSPLLAPVPERPPLLAGFAAKPAPRHPLIGTGQCLKRYLL